MEFEMGVQAALTSGRPWDALTTTNRGILTLEELLENHRDDAPWDVVPHGLSVLQGQDRPGIRGTLDSGKGSITRLTMTYGLKVESSPNHEWFVTHRTINGRRMAHGDFVRADHIQVGDILEVVPGVYDCMVPYRFAAFPTVALKMRGKDNPITQPEAMTEDLAWLFGYLWGDGSMSPGGFRIRFIDAMTVNLEKAQRILREIFSVEAGIRRASQGRKAQTLEFASKMLWHWLIRNGVYKYFANELDLIPRCVRASSRDHIIAFIAGLLDSDGSAAYANNGVGRITITTASGFFAHHLQQVGWAVGLPFGRSLNSHGINLQSKREMYLLGLSAHVRAEHFGVLGRNSTKITIQEASEQFSRWEWQGPRARCLLMGRVKAIEDGDPQATFDVSTENGWYYAGAVKGRTSSGPACAASPPAASDASAILATPALASTVSSRARAEQLSLLPT